MLKLSISNIGWSQDQDSEIYELMHQYGFCGLEIAPTRIFPKDPYDDLDEAGKWSKTILETEGLTVSSIQSIWYGKTERIFGTKEERQLLLEYTKAAIRFAETVGATNLVFGCPRNRQMPSDATEEIAISFFRELGEYAYSHGTCIGMEANPPIYNTNYINTTEEAFELIDKVDSKGFKLNLDLGTMIYNQEDAALIDKRIDLINHIHISEPNLVPIQKREIHSDVKRVIDGQYKGYVSIEMGKVNDLNDIEECMAYVREVFV